MLLSQPACSIFMPAGMITGAKAAVGVQQCVPQGITVLHLQAAAQRLSNLGRPTTARKGCATAAGAGIGLHAGPATVSSSLEGLPSAGSKTCCIVDNATVSALDEASEVDVMAPVMCPADLLSLVNGELHSVGGNSVYSTMLTLGQVTIGAATAVQVSL